MGIFLKNVSFSLILNKNENMLYFGLWVSIFKLRVASLKFEEVGVCCKIRITCIASRRTGYSV